MSQTERDTESEEASIGNIEHVDPASLGPSDVHVRSSHNPPGDQLVTNVGRVGIIHPPIGRVEDGDIRLLDGVRRAKAAAASDIEEIPVIVRDLDDADARAQSITLNSDSGTANNKRVTDNDRGSALDRAADAADKPREELERDVGLLSDADHLARKLDSVTGVGRGTAERIAEADISVDDLRGDGYVALEEIPGIGSGKAEAVRDAICDDGEEEVTVVTHREAI